MSWRSKAALGAALMALTGCGFSPLYGDHAGPSGANVASDLGTIRVNQIGERYGQLMTNQLHDTFKPQGGAIPAVYELNVGLTEIKSDIAARADGTASRSTISMTANWQLRRITDGTVVTSGVVRSQGGHDVLSNEYANVVSADTDEVLAVKDCSDQIEERVALYMRTLHTEEK